MIQTRLSVLAALTGLLAPGAVAQADAGLVLLNGRIAVGDGPYIQVEAATVRDGRFVFLGSSAEAREYIGAATRVIDLGDRIAFAGLADNYFHDAGGGPGVDLSAARTLDDVLRAIAAAGAKAEPGGVIRTNSDWHEAQLREQRLPLRRDIDRVAPDHPVVVVRGGHEMILNSAALQVWDITPETPVPPGGQISRYPDGELNGELMDAAMRLVPRTPQPPVTAERLAEQFRKLNAAGLTSIRIPGGSPRLYRILRGMRDEDRLTLRVNFLFRLTDSSSEERVRDQVASWGVAPDEGNVWLRVGGVKLGVDGGFEGGWMRAPYEEPYGRNGSYAGLQTMSAEGFLTAVRTLNALGWRVATHAVGDAAIDMVLRGYEQANEERTIAGGRWAIEHAFIARPDHLPRMKALGLVISAQHHLWLAGPSLVHYWGRQRAELTTPMRSFIDAGLMVSTGSDSPVVPYSPFKTFYHFVTRDTITGGVLGSDQRISRGKALRAATLGNAFLTMEEGEKGSIAVGKLADLTVVSEDLLTASDDALARAEALMTIVGGKVVYEK